MRAAAGSAFLFAAIVLLACGCGSTLDPVAAGATKTGKEGGKFTLTMNMAAGKDVESIRGDGKFAADGTTQMNMHVFDPVSFKEGKVEVVATTENGDEVFYLKTAALKGQLPAGKTWARIDMTEVAEQRGMTSQLPAVGPASDPTQMMQLLRETSGGVTEAGSDSILGIEATRYHANLELPKILELEGLSKSQAEKLPKSVASAKIPADVWIDSDGYLRAFRIRFNAGHQFMTMRMNVTEIGAQLVALPPSDQTYDATDEAAKG